MNVIASAVAALLVLAAAVRAPAPQTSPLRVLTTRALATVLAEVGPDFERESGHELRITADIAARLIRDIDRGDPFDLLIAAPDQLDTLVRSGRIVAETRVDLAQSPIGMAVRAGARTYDIGSMDAFARALREAKSIAFLKEGQSGVYLARVLEERGLAGAIEPKVVRPERDVVCELVAAGEVEIGLVVVTQILTTPGVALAGPLPAEIQRPIVFAAGISRQSANADAAASLLAFLSGPRAADVMRRQGLEPLIRNRM